MARLARLSLAGHVHFVSQRGNNGQNIFSDSEDRECFLALLKDSVRYGRVALHAYVLLENQFQLLLTPQDDTGLPRLMQTLGRSYVRHFNDRHRRSGTLWDGRYRSAIIDAKEYLLPCMAYMDSMPVRCGLVDRAEHFPWSSFAHYSGRQIERFISPHIQIWSLGNTPFAREAAYFERVQSAAQESAFESELARALLGGWALGTADFVASVQAKATRRVSKGLPGRPVKSKQRG